MNEDKLITLENENGEKELAEILFTFKNDEKNYVILTLVKEYEDLDEEVDVLAYQYQELEDATIGELFEIEEDDFETWDVIEELLNTFEDTSMLQEDLDD